MSGFKDLPELKKAFTTKVQACGHLILPDYVILDRSSPAWQWCQAKTAEKRGLVKERFVEIDEQETQLRYELTDEGRRELFPA